MRSDSGLRGSEAGLNGIVRQRKAAAAALWTAFFLGIIAAARAAGVPDDNDSAQSAPPASASKPQASTERPPAVTGLPPWGPRMRPMLPRLSLGADFRLRHEYHYNLFTLNSSAPNPEYDYERYRIRPAASLRPLRSLELNVRLATERRWYIKPDSLEGSRPDEILFDAMNLVLRNPGGLPLTLTIGRQDIVFGNGWVIMEGTPTDGSRTIFFDAARLTWDFKGAKTTFDVIGMANSAFPDTWLPVAHDMHKPTIEQKENAAIVYASNRSVSKTAIDGYFVYKHDRKVQASGDNAEFSALGSLAQRELSPHWRYRIEAALERGNKNGSDLRAFGLTHRLTYLFGDARNNRVHFGQEYLSGDDPDTKGVDEGWDPLWGRWPQWSELVVNNLSSETRVGNWTNLHRFDFGWGFSPTKKLEVSVNYMPLFAPNNSVRGKPGFSENGRFRGHYGQAILRYRFTDHFNAHLWGEFLVPGSYYSVSKGDTACFLRAEMVLRW
jgi:Alginate export